MMKDPNNGVDIEGLEDTGANTSDLSKTLRIQIYHFRRFTHSL